MVKSGDMVIGQYTSKVADNGRTALPKKFREELGVKFVITQGYEGSLLIVPVENWEQMVKETTDKPFLMGQARDVTRFLLGGATYIDLDEQGRFIIPSYLRTYGQVGTEIIFLGLGKYIEVWDMKKWQDYHKGLSGNIENIAQKLANFKNGE